MKISTTGMSGVVLGLSLAVMTGVVWAGEVKDREANQQDRIAQGVNSGELTAGEAGRLEKGEQKIENDREKALSDGKLTPQEKAKLNREENKQSNKIHAAKHNVKKARR